jgi:hypothetical protein
MDEVGITSLEARLLDAHLKHIQADLKRQGDVLSGINQSLQLLARVEQTQMDIKDRLKEGSQKLTEHDKRIAAIETIVPVSQINARDLGAALAKLIFFV